MTSTQKIEKNPMGEKSIPKLLISLAVPAVIANVVNALYNIVDQIFIGQGVGYLGNAATNIAFPLTTICMAIGLMTGLGSAANFNLELGRKNPDNAKRVAGTAAGTLLICGILLCMIIRIFLKPLMLMFGATDQILDYAMEYTGITSFGIPFLLFSTGINPLVRADGSSTYSMLSIVTGAILNIILDPLFIFVFKMGIAGAAWATVISQIISSVLLAFYFPKFKMVHFQVNEIAKIWLNTNIKAHNFIPAQYWQSNFETVKKMFLQAEIYIYENEKTDKVQGFIGLSDCYIAGIFICREAQSNRIGKQLLDFVKKIKTELSLNVYKKNVRAVKFYQRENFRIHSEDIDENTREEEYVMIWKQH